MEQAADLLYGLLSPDLYLLFVNERGRPGERWERWRVRGSCTSIAPTSVHSGSGLHLLGCWRRCSRCTDAIPAQGGGCRHQ
ncbi:hypothetical protein OG930_41495 [Streptomyces sp. NBC_01799]|uniref:hypothetical protein n=1 Tax=Streptomyces sp. NBC_01800 TaxID=2975945 RepID=UPI002DD8F464|nr:hypothetical protein [Streptomyces sp. NBC_01800]WSA72939.1 hypothetical protein OIE65_42120 [Streptomyces sp. NBC_01800]WSA81465.1 hypothetical protein OG930_41495 [Streptomyces sp. NBC_01799]